jgi:hypothetical protein
MDEEYWVAYRKRARKRANAWGAFAFCPFIIAVALLSLTQRPNFQVLRDNPTLHVLVSGVFLAFGVIGLVGSVRWLLADRHRPK